MIELLLSGGLGNQMFQYACARSLQIRNQENLAVNTWLYGNGSERLGRQCALTHLHIPNEIAFLHRPRRFIRLMGGLSRYSGETIYKLGNFAGNCIWRGRAYRDLNLSGRGKRKYLYGYFMSEKYFIPHATQIVEELRPRASAKEENQRLRRQIENSNAVCVHIRRGDYVGTEYEVCSLSYYFRAIEYIRKHTIDARYFFFSDDIDWVKRHFVGDKFVFVDLKNEDYEDMELMQHCKHFILSNSTFSWWAQYLSSHQKKIVIAPERWMKYEDDKVFQDLYLSSWIRL